MSQIASFYLVNGGQREELPDGGCSGEVYMAILEYCEGELDIDCRINAPQNEDTLDCALIDAELAEKLWDAFQERDLSPSGLAAEIAPDWELPVEAVERGMKTFLSHLERAKGNTILLYQMT